LTKSYRAQTDRQVAISRSFFCLAIADFCKMVVVFLFFPLGIGRRAADPVILKGALSLAGVRQR
jgi:hypothetical protein